MIFAGKIPEFYIIKPPVTTYGRPNNRPKNIFSRIFRAPVSYAYKPVLPERWKAELT